MKQMIGSLLIVTLLAPVSMAGSLDELVSSDAKVELVADGFKFTEGPAWHPDGFLLFSDIPNERVIKLDQNGALTDFYAPSNRCNGLMCDQQGHVYACQGGAGKLLRFDANGQNKKVLAETFRGKALNATNDLALDTHGGVYFTDPYYGKERDLPQPMMGVYYLNSAGKLTRIIQDLQRPNGVTVSPDGKYLYVAEPNLSQVFRYEIQAPGKITAGTLIFQGDPELDGGGPDGMTHDVHGNLYATYKGIVVLNPEGGVIGRIAVPQKPANCTFGGLDYQTLYITARSGLYKIPMKVKGISLVSSGPKLTSVRQNSISFLKSLTMPVVLLDDTTPLKLGDIELALPSSWKQEQPSSRMRLGQISIPAADGDEEAAELAIFPPFGGSVDANLERWVNQFGPQGLTSSIKKGKSNQGDYYLADLTGTYKKPDGPPFLRKTIDAPGYRMLAVILSVEGKGNYFLKLVGPQATVAKAVDQFRASFGADAESEEDYELK